tara:strand:+ start:1277 stop:1807 length:531 start_codon:yes stop_codon:yes gene_type:complete
MSLFDYPVPGQSLTTTPKNASYERPPQVTDPRKALQIHVENLGNKQSVEDLKYYVEMGLDVKSIVEAILRSAVAEGVHSIDISLIIAPLLHQIVVSILDKMGIEYDEGISDVLEDENINFQRNKMRARKMLDGVKGDDIDLPDDMDLELTGSSDATLTEEEEKTVEEPVRGLMARS